MCIWNKVLIGLICLASIFFFILSARSLKRHHQWQAKVVKTEGELTKAREEMKLLEEGDDQTPSLQALELALHTRLLDRARAWYNVRPLDVRAGKDPASGQNTLLVSVQVQPVPHGIAAQSVLFLFDGKPFQQGGRYLGQFTVTNVVENGPVQLRANTRLTGPEAARIGASQQSQAPWALYEIMPKDEHRVFQELSEEQLKVIIPPDEVAEYVNDGKMMTLEAKQESELDGRVLQVDETGELVIAENEQGDPGYVELGLDEGKGMFLRQLRDYEALFTDYYLRRTILVDRINATSNDIKYLGSANTNALAQEQRGQKEIDEAKGGLASVTGQRDAVAGYQATLQERLAAVRGGIEQLIRENQKLAGELAKMQADAIRRVDQRTREMARADTP